MGYAHGSWDMHKTHTLSHILSTCLNTFYWFAPLVCGHCHLYLGACAACCAACRVRHACALLQERLAAAGGRVFFNSGLRVMGILATTRAIGDHDLRPYGVVPTPDVLVLPRATEQEFLVLGSDGLWDVFNNQVGCCCVDVLVQNSMRCVA